MIRRLNNPTATRIVVTTVGIGATFLLLGLLLRTTYSHLRDKATPPAGMNTFDDYVAWHPNTTNFAVRVVNGTEYVEAIGPPVSLSGPTGYVFDRSGRFVDWTVDSGDDSAYQSKWHRNHPPPLLDRAGVRRWMAGAPQTAPVTRSGTGPQRSAVIDGRAPLIRLPLEMRA